ncbi:hypothetical protein WMY93_027782 [Mugilogobius chulae]|uniref:Uncharacterized protein n=1 Tax=Mugilogobius chulae TaxID=88201 RepID=A0AAW0N6B8_9GOBI
MGLERFGVSVFENCRTIVTPPAPTPDEMRTNVTSSQSTPPEVEVTEEEDAAPSTTNHDVTRSASALAVSVREQCHLSQKTVNNIMSGVQQYQAVLINVLRERMQKVFEQHPEMSSHLQNEACLHLIHLRILSQPVHMDKIRL